MLCQLFVPPHELKAADGSWCSRTVATPTQSRLDFPGEVELRRTFIHGLEPQATAQQTWQLWREFSAPVTMCRKGAKALIS